MAETRSTTLYCARCGLFGSATWRSRGTDRQVDLVSVSEGFIGIGENDHGGHHFACVGCKIVARETGHGR